MARDSPVGGCLVRSLLRLCAVRPMTADRTISRMVGAGSDCVPARPTRRASRRGVANLEGLDLLSLRFGADMAEWGRVSQDTRRERILISWVRV